MQIVQISDITIRPKRFRADFNEEQLDELVSSIQLIGLLHPPVAMQVDDQLILLAGERRFRAISKLASQGIRIQHGDLLLPCGLLPLTVLDPKDDLGAMQIELDENAVRQNLTWQEHACAVASLHELRLAQNPAHTMQDTAREMGVTHVVDKVRNEKLLADNLHRPEVAKAADRESALKALRVSLLREFETRLGMLPTTPADAEEDMKLISGDCLKTLATLPDESVDCFCTDPPYGIGADKFGMGQDTEILHNYTDSWGELIPMYYALAAEMFRVAKSQCHAYVFCDIRRFKELAGIFEEYGWTPWPTPLIWSKGSGLFPKAFLGPSRTYEAILYLNKGDKPVNINASDVLSFQPVQEKLHAAQKPVELYTSLLQRSCSVRDLVVDPFCGSGTIFEAAFKLNLRAIGMENDPQSVGICQERMASLENKRNR